MAKWVLALSLLCATPAFAQFGVGPVAVSDAPLEADSIKSLLNQATALQLLTTTAQSVTDGGGAGLFAPATEYLDSLNHGLTNSQVFAANFPGWQPLPPTAAAVSRAVVTYTMATYAGVLNAASQQAAGMSNEDQHLADIEARSAAATGLQQAVQANTEATLALNQQVQLLRQLMLLQLTVETVRAGEELNEKSRAAATTAMNLNHGVLP